MTTATYRGVQYDVEEHKINVLQMIKEQLEKAKRLQDAQKQTLLKGQ